MSFYRGLLGVMGAFDDDPTVDRPGRGIAFGIGVEHLGEEPNEGLVRLELTLDLVQKGFGDGFCVTEDADRDLRILQDFLNDPSEGDQRRLVAFPEPDIYEAIGSRLDLPASYIQPRVPSVIPTQELDQQVIAVNERQSLGGREILALKIHRIPAGEQLTER